MTLQRTETPAVDQKMSEAAADVTLSLSRHFKAPRETVFRAFTDPNELVRWWGPEGMDVPEIHLDVRPGGKWRTCMRSSEGNVHNVGGVYREIVPPERLVMTWTWEQGDLEGREMLVTLEFAESNGGTELRLTHAQLPSESWRDAHRGGWSSSLDCLERYLREEAAGS